VCRHLSNRLTRSALLLIALSGNVSAGSMNVPDWVRQLASAPSGTYPPETKALVLLDQTDYTVTAPGAYTEHSRHVVRILRPEGRDEGDLAVHLKQGEKMISLHAWTLDSSGHQYELKDKDFIEKSFSSYELYSDIHYLTAKAPAAYPGSVIAFEYEVRRHAYVGQINQFFQEPNPVREVIISLTLPAGWEFKDFWSATQPLAPAQTAANHWEWKAHNLPGVEEEEVMMPPLSMILGRLAISYFQPGGTENASSWKAIGLWYRDLTAGRRDPTPEIMAQVQSLTAGKTDFDSKLRALTGFLQSEVRYVAIEIGVGGYQPHPAQEIFHYRYGDCKDKAALLSTMLQAAGIHSDFVLIDTDRGFVNPAVPSVWFDHAILAIELPPDVQSDSYRSVITAKSGRRYIVFDPTDEYTPVGSLRAELQDSYALLVTDSGGELIRTPLLPPEANTLTRIGHFVLTADGNLSGEVSEDRSGEFAMGERYQLRDTDQRERTLAFERWLGRSVQGFSLDKVDIQQADQIRKDVLISYRFTTPHYGQMRGPLMLLRARVLGDDGQFVERKARRYPVELESAACRTDTYEIQIPQEYSVEELPDPVNIDVGFASYQSKFEVEGPKLRYWREYVLRDLSVPPDKFPDWMRLQGLIGADQDSAVILKRVP
jgi:Domain of Unknown Function with PDB structure (DUF3857)/Transglutaminase-like superfamily